MLPISVIVNAILRPLLERALSEDRARIRDIEERMFNSYFEQYLAEGASLDEASTKAREMADIYVRQAEESPGWAVDDQRRWYPTDDQARGEMEEARLKQHAALLSWLAHKPVERLDLKELQNVAAKLRRMYASGDIFPSAYRGCRRLVLTLCIEARSRTSRQPSGNREVGEGGGEGSET